MNEPDTPPASDARSRSPISWFIWIPATFIIYALSPGPVFKLAGKKSGTLAETVYLPLALADAHVPAVHKFYQWYGRLWGL